MKILYDLEITTGESGRDGQRMVVVTATVRRYSLDPATKMAKPIPEPATRVDRAISYQTLAACRRPADVREAERNAVVDEAMRVAAAATLPAGLRHAKKQLQASKQTKRPTTPVARYGPSFKNLGAVGPASTGPGTWCQICGWHDSMDDSGVCRKCGDIEVCSECSGTGEVQLFTSVQPCSRGCRLPGHRGPKP